MRRFNALPTAASPRGSLQPLIYQTYQAYLHRYVTLIDLPFDRSFTKKKTAHLLILPTLLLKLAHTTSLLESSSSVGHTIHTSLPLIAIAPLVAHLSIRHPSRQSSSHQCGSRNLKRTPVTMPVYALSCAQWRTRLRSLGQRVPRRRG